MRKANRIISLFLTFALLAYGLPVNSTAIAESDVENVDPPIPTTDMRFIQTGFSEDGILTMSLQMKPKDGQNISEGVFAFQTDAATVVPLTRPYDGSPRQRILRSDGSVAVVADPQNTAIAEYIEGGWGSLVSGTFNTTMGSYFLEGDFKGQPKFDTSTGFLVSSERITETKMLDCYFQFRYEWSRYPEVDADGYVNVMDFDFQCYSGKNDDGTPKPATSEDALFIQSIQIPETIQESKDILSQFYYEKQGEDGETTGSPEGSQTNMVKVDMAMGAAGYIQKYRDEDDEKIEGNAYYYFEEPVINSWRKGQSVTRTRWSTNDPEKILTDTAPGHWYRHMQDKYVVKSFTAACNNTFSTDTVWEENPDDPTQPPVESPVKDPDFIVPELDELGSYPRYIIPTKDQSEQNDVGRSWIPVAYNGDGSPVPLKYFLSTTVSGNSISSPEHENFEEFMQNIKWEFMLDDGTSLEECQVTVDEEEGKLIETSEGKYYRVRHARVTDAKYDPAVATNKYNCLYGTKVQKIYFADDPENPAADRYYMTAPVGVTLDMDPNTQVTYNDLEEGRTVAARAPQLHLTSDAADPDSCIWQSHTSGQMFLRAIYDPQGAALKDREITVRLYKEASVASYADLRTEEIGTILGEDGTTDVEGFFVGNTKLDGTGKETVQDCVSTGIAVHSSLYDQYGFVVPGAWNRLELVPTASTQAAMDAAGKGENPFEIVQVERPKQDSETGEKELTDEYTIKYKSGKSANDVVRGQYILRAVNGSIEKTKTIYVDKAEDRLTHMVTGLTNSHEIVSEEAVEGGTVIAVRYRVPARPSTGALTTITETINIRELSNQWRVPGNYVEDISLYDIVSGIRTGDGQKIDVQAARDKGVRLSFKASFPEGAGYPQGAIDTKLISQGKFTFNSDTPDGANFSCRVTSEYGGQSRFVEYRFQFYREEPSLQTIEIKRPDTNPTLTVYVPTASSGKTAELLLDVIPIDQYGSQWNWSSVEDAYAPGHRLNLEGIVYPEWRVYSKGDLPDGVKLTGDNFTTIEVNSTAKTCTFDVYAQFATKSSSPTTITVLREPSKPAKIANISYNKQTTIISPDKNSQDVTILPTMKVYDQYDDEMTGYDMRWKFTTSVDTNGKIEVNENTGEIVVKKCAPECKVKITVWASKNGEREVGYVDLEIKRTPVDVETIEITTASPISYPTLEELSTGSAVGIYMGARGTTQYGDDEELKPEELRWTLESVTFPDKTLSGKDISFNGNKYSARSVTLTSGGTLNFNGVTDAVNIPEKLKVSVIYGGAVSQDPVEKELVISREASVPNTLYIPESTYKGGIQIPAYGNSVTKKLEAYVRDQYGVVMPNAEISWESVGILPQGVKFDKKANSITVDHNAVPGSFQLTAKSPSSSLNDESIYISIYQNEPLEVSFVEVSGIKNQESLEIALPAKTGVGDTYTMQCLVKDQFTKPMSGAIQWSVEEAGGVDVRFTDTASGRMFIRFTEEAFLNGSSQVVVRAASTDNPSVYGEATITVIRQEAEPAYALSVMTDAGEGAVLDNGIWKPVVPQKGDGSATKVKIEASVYSQYGKLMENEKANISLKTPSKGLSLEQIAGTNIGELSISSTVTGLLVSVIAVPEKNPGGILDESTLTITLSKGTAYPYELILDQNNDYKFTLPKWNSPAVANKPAEETIDQLVLEAWVVDQYGAWIESDSARIHPVWQFVGSHSGVSFSENMKINADGDAEGEQLELDISNYAVGEGKREEYVKLRVYTSGKDKTGDFVKEITLRLFKPEPPAETYLYIEGVNEHGVANAVERPYATVGVMTYQFRPVIYDQYGAKVKDAEIEIDMVKSVAEAQAIVESIYKPGESEEKGNRPIAYKIYREEEPGRRSDTASQKILMAEFSLETGELKVYTESTLTQLAFTARSKALGDTGGFKTMILPIHQETFHPSSVEINRSHGDFVLGGESDNISDYVYPVVYDQYGQHYIGDIQIEWSLHLRSEDGSLEEYDTELDEDGNPRTSGEFLVLLERSTEDNAATVIVQPESYFENKTVVLQCRVIDRTDVNLDRIVYETSDIKVYRRSNIGSGELTVTFDAGKYGKLVGQAEQNVSFGEYPLNAPGVKTVLGYGFMGWTSDGKTVVDAAKVPLFEDTAYTAVYKDVTNTRFLDGYKDHTVRVQQSVTRAEFVKMLVSALGGYNAETDYGKSFCDVAQGEWYANYVAYAKKQGILGGYPDGTFRPNAPINRAEAAKLLAEATKLTSSRMGSFSDVDGSKWYSQYIEALHEAGIADGYGDGTYRPNRRISRAEAVKMIVMVTKNALNDLERRNIQEFAYCPFTDVKKSHWAYVYILRAAGIA